MKRPFNIVSDPLSNLAFIAARHSSPRLALIDGSPQSTIAELQGADLTVVELVERPLRPDHHATFMASVLVGRRLGLLPRAQLLALAVTAADGSIDPGLVAAAVGEACRRGATTIVVPLGDHRHHLAVEAAISRAMGRGATVVAAAGNAHPHPLLFPARLPGVVAVGACDPGGVLLEDCCRSPRLDLVIPAKAILGADASGCESTRSGTSVAAVLAGALLAVGAVRARPHAAATHQQDFS